MVSVRKVGISHCIFGINEAYCRCVHLGLPVLLGAEDCRPFSRTGGACGGVGAPIEDS